MVLSKASVWYENVVKPLRRLTSATNNTLSVGQRHPHRASSPAKSKPGEEFGAENSPVQECVFTANPKQESGQKHQQTWEAFFQNPLDVVLSDAQAPEHPINMMSQRLNKPFSTSVVDQARGKQPEKQTPRPLIERPTRRSTTTTTQVPKPLARQREFGSKKYRKCFREKIMRKGPNFNIRRRNRLFMESYPGEMNSTSSMNFFDNWKDKPHTSSVGNNDNPMKFGIEESIMNLSLHNVSTSGVGDVIERPLDNNRESAVTSHSKKNEESCPSHCASVKTQKRSTTDSLMSSADTSKTTVSSSVNVFTKGSPYCCNEKLPMSANEKAACCEDAPRGFLCGSSKRATVARMRDNFQVAAQGFKCSLWKRALTGDTQFYTPLRLVEYAPC